MTSAGSRVSHASSPQVQNCHEVLGESGSPPLGVYHGHTDNVHSCFVLSLIHLLGMCRALCYVLKIQQRERPSPGLQCGKQGCEELHRHYESSEKETLSQP